MAQNIPLSYAQELEDTSAPHRILTVLGGIGYKVINVEPLNEVGGPHPRSANNITVTIEHTNRRITLVAQGVAKSLSLPDPCMVGAGLHEMLKDAGGESEGTKKRSVRRSVSLMELTPKRPSELKSESVSRCQSLVKLDQAAKLGKVQPEVPFQLQAPKTSSPICNPNTKLAIQKLTSMRQEIDQTIRLLEGEGLPSFNISPIAKTHKPPLNPPIKPSLKAFKKDVMAKPLHLQRPNKPVLQKAKLVASVKQYGPRKVSGSIGDLFLRVLPKIYVKISLENLRKQQRLNMANEAEETVRKLATHKGVVGVIVVNGEGIPIKSTLENHVSVQYAGLMSALLDKAKSVVRDLDPTNDLTFLRIRSKKSEVLVAPDKDFILIVIQSPVE